MFGWKVRTVFDLEREIKQDLREPKAVEVVEATPAPTVELPVSVAMVTPPPVDRDFEVEYLKVAGELGIFSPLARESRIRAFEIKLAEMGLRIYDGEQVASYLTGVFGKEIWSAPLGARGRQRLATWAWRPLVEKRIFIGGRDQLVTNGQLASDLISYSKPIPLPVLLTVKTLLDSFPSAVFYISDSVTAAEATPKNLDPFLLVRHEDQSYIIERWDEPNYRERTITKEPSDAQ